MVINAGHPGIIVTHLLFEKHFHAAPLLRTGAASNPQQHIIQQLPRPGGFDRNAGANQRQREDLGAEDRARAKGTDHLVVAHVNHPYVAVPPRGLTGDGPEDVRIDGGHGGVDDLNAPLGIAVAQQHLKNPGESKRGRRITFRRRLAEDKHSQSSLRLDR